MLLPHIFLTPHIAVDPATNVRKKIVTTKFWQVFLLSYPIVMRVVAETANNQITFIFSKE